MPSNERAELRDYRGSGYDRGHASPNGDMPTPEAQSSSFSLANIFPQNPNLNRHTWEGIEAAIRQLAERKGELFVITGPLFTGEYLQQLNGRVLVPTKVSRHQLLSPSLGTRKEGDVGFARSASL